jgi:hypothetical protein
MKPNVGAGLHGDQRARDTRLLFAPVTMTPGGSDGLSGHLAHTVTGWLGRRSLAAL